MAVDILGVLAAQATIATTTQSTGVDLGAGGALPAGSPRRGLVARILVTTATSTTTNACTFTMEHSSDNTNWKTLAGAALGLADDLALTTTAQSREIFIPFETVQRYIRLVATISGAGTASVSYNAYLAPSLP